MDYADLQAQVKILIGDTSDKFFTPDEVKDALNRVMPEIAEALEANLTFTDYDMVASTQRYSLPSDFMIGKKASLHIDTTDHRELVELDLNQFEQVSAGTADQEGISIYYKIELGSVLATDDPQIPGDLWLYPIPNDATWNVRLYYLQLPEDMSGETDSPILPIHSHMAVAEKAAADLALKNGDIPLHNILHGRYTASIARSQAMLHRRAYGNRYPNMKDVM